jgi:lipopolysaccharide transport system ATP-binding protein
MSDIAIRVENLSKRYRIGEREPYKTLRDTIAKAVSSPFHRIRNSSGQPSVVGGHNNFIWALKDVSFEIKQGEVVGIIGRNGAGKTTLLKILSRITEPTEGYAEVRGRVGSLLEVGTGFHPELTGRENIYLNGAILGMKKREIDRKFDEIVEFAEIEKFIDTPVKRYSSGMYVRLAFAVAAHLEPEILLVDEVLAVGDAAFQKKCLGKMGDVAKEGRTVLFVSHNMDAIRKLCPRAIRLDNGNIKSVGSTDSVITQYLGDGALEITPYVSLPTIPSDSPGTGISLQFFASDGTSRAWFHLDEPWQIVFEFEIFKPTAHVIAAVGIVTFGSVPIITYWSKPKNLIPGKYQVVFECNLPLRCTDLQFTVGLSSYENAFYYVDGVGHVSISEVAKRKQPFRTSGAAILWSTQESTIKSVGT